jgi:hypothetical protein
LACDCEAYDPPQDPSVPSKCQECGHGRVVIALSPLKQAVLDTFAAHSEKPVSDRLSSKARVTDLATAKDNALKGFHVASDTEGSSSKLKDKKKAVSGVLIYRSSRC